MPSSPQATGIPNRPSARHLVERLSTTMESSGVLGPNLITANGQALPRQKKTLFRQIQNCGTVPVKYLIDNDNDCTALNFHGVLAACTAEDDGLGSILNLSKVSDRVTIIGVGGTPRVCTFVGVTPETN